MISVIIPLMALAKAAVGRRVTVKPWKWGRGPDPDRPGYLPARYLDEFPPPPVVVVPPTPPTVSRETHKAVVVAATQILPVITPVVVAPSKPAEFRRQAAISKVLGFGFKAERPADVWVPGYEIPGGYVGGYLTPVPQLRHRR